MEVKNSLVWKYRISHHPERRMQIMGNVILFFFWLVQ